MPRLGIGIALLCLASLGCSKATAAASSPPIAPGAANAPITQVGALADGPRSVALTELADRDRPWLTTSTASDYILIGQTEQVFGVWVDVPKGTGQHVPTSLTLAIDTSGSMRGDKIVHAREAARRLIDELEDGDIVSLVTFSGSGRVLLPATPLDESRRRELNNLIEELSADGGTAMHEGLSLAQSQLWTTPDTHLVRRLIVISDGKATVGPTSPHRLGQIAQVGLQKAIQVTALGVGLDYDELTLNALAVRSSGRLYHVERSEQLPSIVEEEIALLESTAAAKVEVEVVGAPGVQILGTTVAQSEASRNGIRIPLGTMFGGQAREILVRARVTGDGIEGPRVLASVRLHYRDTADGGLSRVQESVLRATVTDDPALVAEFAHSRLETLLAVRDASTWAQRASAQLNLGDLDAADDELARAEQRLRVQHDRATTEVERAQTQRSVARISTQRAGIKKAKRKSGAARKRDSRKLSLETNDAAMGDLGF